MPMPVSERVVSLVAPKLIAEPFNHLSAECPLYQPVPASEKPAQFHSRIERASALLRSIFIVFRVSDATAVPRSQDIGVPSSPFIRAGCL
jgi:hypothetical protein